MGKGLAVVGILGAIAATLTILNVLLDLAQFLVLPVIVAGSIVLVAQRSVGGAVAGLLVLALAVVTALGLADSVGSITTEGGTTSFGFTAEGGHLLALAGCLSIPLAALIVRWDRVDPQSLAYVGIFCAAVAFLLVAIRADPTGLQTNPVTLVAGLVPLGCIAPMVGLWRGANKAEGAVQETAPPAP
jgi:hypothetical protein